MKIKPWIEAMRLRTLPVSLAGVVTALAFTLRSDSPRRPLPALLCVLFAVMAQIASNFANEYFDFRDGLDRVGRDGPRRGVTEGDITPRAMLIATIATLAAACAIGLGLVAWGGWWLIAAGVVIVAGALAYSAGPYPLSRHGYGEVSVIFFFGIVPVTLTYWLQTETLTRAVVYGAVAIGLMAANVLIVNNYRDADDDAAVGKRTMAVIFGRSTASALYLINGVVAAVLFVATGFSETRWISGVYLAIHLWLWQVMRSHRGPMLNRVLGLTAMLMFAYSLVFLLTI